MYMYDIKKEKIENKRIIFFNFLTKYLFVIVK